MKAHLHWLFVLDGVLGMLRLSCVIKRTAPLIALLNAHLRLLHFLHYHAIFVQKFDLLGIHRAQTSLNRAVQLGQNVLDCTENAHLASAVASPPEKLSLILFAKLTKL